MKHYGMENKRIQNNEAKAHEDKTPKQGQIPAHIALMQEKGYLGGNEFHAGQTPLSGDFLMSPKIPVRCFKVILSQSEPGNLAI